MNTMEGSDRHWDDEIGLEGYVLTLIAWGREILLGVLLLGLFGGVAALAARTIFPDYEASADVAIIRTHTEVAIDDRFRAVSTGATRVRDRNRTARRFALLGLVHQGDVARTVFGKLADLWKDDEYSEADLLESISAELVTEEDVPTRHKNESDLIRITASADSPEKAAVIANTWASEFVRAVNLLYRPVPEDVIVRVNNERLISEERYNDLQTELEALLAESDSGSLKHQIELNNLRLQSLRELWHKISITLIDIRINDHIASLEGDYDVRRKLKKLLADAKAHRAQIEEQTKANAALSNTIGFSNQLLNLQAYTLSGSIPEGLEIILDNSHPNSTDMAGQSIEGNSIITAITRRLVQLDRSIESSTKNLLSDTQPSISPIISSENEVLNAMDDLESENRRLSAQLEKIDANIQSLTHKRDTARSTFETLQNEITELRLTSAASPSELRLASRAVEPSRSSRPSPVFIATVVGGIGLLALMFVAFVLNSVGIRPFLENQRTESVV